MLTFTAYRPITMQHKASPNPNNVRFGAPKPSKQPTYSDQYYHDAVAQQQLPGVATYQQVQNLWRTQKLIHPAATPSQLNELLSDLDMAAKRRSTDAATTSYQALKDTLEVIQAWQQYRVEESADPAACKRVLQLFQERYDIASADSRRLPTHAGDNKVNSYNDKIMKEKMRILKLDIEDFEEKCIALGKITNSDGK
jgi:hypothetical protein